MPGRIWPIEVSERVSCRAAHFEPARVKFCPGLRMLWPKNEQWKWFFANNFRLPWRIWLCYGSKCLFSSAASSCKIWCESTLGRAYSSQNIDLTSLLTSQIYVSQVRKLFHRILSKEMILAFIIVMATQIMQKTNLTSLTSPWRQAMSRRFWVQTLFIRYKLAFGH